MLRPRDQRCGRGNRDGNGRIDHEREAAGQAPFRALSREICNVPGINVRSAGMILAETGLDMGRFATAAHIVAWTGLCPGQNESPRNGAPWLKTTLVQCAVPPSRSYFRAQFRRLKARRVAPKPSARWLHPLLTTIYHMLKAAPRIATLGAAHFDAEPR